ncbi:MAG: hypothetical protein KJO07_18090, partial [Deltaproteobacteria bacterium]|nr:hypothetical protein [Deltaproteobacteria bacterium]
LRALVALAVAGAPATLVAGDDAGEDDVADKLDLPSLDDEDVPDGTERGQVQGDERDGDRDIRDRLDSLPFDISLKLEARVGSRAYRDVVMDRLTLGEGRLQLHLEKHVSAAELRFVTTTDFLYDTRGDTSGVDLQRGTGLVDLRQAYVGAKPVDAITVKVGRQIATWGTGDLLFINDLFPKDWQAFLLGRQIEYLKAPSDALRVDMSAEEISLSLVFTPQFDPDRFITGERLAYFDGATLQTDGEPLAVSIPDKFLSDVEIAGRARLTVSSFELAAYGYGGFWKSPLGFDVADGRADFPPLAVIGGSVRGPMLGTLASVEGGYYLSIDDTSGTDPFVPNSEIRGLVGAEKSFGPRITIAAQGYFERMQAHAQYLESLPPGLIARDRTRVVLTARTTVDWARERIRVSLFGFYSPTDEDGYLRPALSWELRRFTTLELGANWFLGASETTFFGQHSKNTSVYGALRLSI